MNLRHNPKRIIDQRGLLEGTRKQPQNGNNLGFRSHDKGITWIDRIDKVSEVSTVNISQNHHKKRIYCSYPDISQDVFKHTHYPQNQGAYLLDHNQSFLFFSFLYSILYCLLYLYPYLYSVTLYNYKLILSILLHNTYLKHSPYSVSSTRYSYCLSQATTIAIASHSRYSS